MNLFFAKKLRKSTQIKRHLHIKESKERQKQKDLEEFNSPEKFLHYAMKISINGYQNIFFSIPPNIVTIPDRKQKKISGK